MDVFCDWFSSDPIPFVHWTGTGGGECGCECIGSEVYTCNYHGVCVQLKNNIGNSIEVKDKEGTSDCQQVTEDGCGNGSGRNLPSLYTACYRYVMGIS